ncbi:MAG: hypothetical protein ACKO9G_15410, partial [Dolichospermum sp.]
PSQFTCLGELLWCGRLGYIINNIPYEYWKIVTRKDGHINIRNASDYHLGKSKQEAFTQLMKILENNYCESDIEELG